MLIFSREFTELTVLLIALAIHIPLVSGLELSVSLLLLKILQLGVVQSAGLCHAVEIFNYGVKEVLVKLFLISVVHLLSTQIVTVRLLTSWFLYEYRIY